MEFPKVMTKSKKRLGRGYGSGKGGHTSSRGTKGQKARTSVGILFEGYKVRKSLLNRLPLQRGKGKFKSRKKSLIVNLDHLNMLPEGSTVDIQLLAKAGVIRLEEARKMGVKVLGDGTLKKKMKVMLPTSKSAKEMIEKAGGEVL